MSKSLLLVAAVLSFVSAAAAQPAPPPPADNKPDATLRSTPETVVWGYIPASVPPALRIKSGQTVRIDTVSHSGVNTGIDPVTYFGRAGIPADQVLQDAKDIFEKVPRPKGGSAHILTGPLYIDEAKPGDMLEIRILALEPRVPYGVNNSNKGTGVLPDLLPGPSAKVIRLDTARNVALFSDDIEIPLQPFMGIMAVAPGKDTWIISSRPPGRYGGNMDFNKLTTARNSSPATRTRCKATARSTAPRSRLRSPARSSSSCTRARAKPCAGRARRMPTITMRWDSISTLTRRSSRPRRRRSNSCARRKGSRPRMPTRSRAWRWISASARRSMPCRWCTA
jgi:Acetamidase/Formamidase family